MTAGKPKGRLRKRQTNSQKQRPVPPALISNQQPPLHFDGSNFFRQRIILSTIFNRPIRISDIRSDGVDPGLRQYEASLLRLLDRVTDGGNIHVDVTGTELRYKPGQIVGGSDIVYDCGLERNVTYFLEALLFLAPFGKKPLRIRLKGITHGTGTSVREPSVDYFRTCVLPFMEKMGIREGLSLTVLKRGIPPLGKGEVEFTCPIVDKVAPFQLLEEGRVKRVRGTSFTNNVSPQFGVRMIDRARALLNDFLPDVWIYDAKSRGGVDGPSAGYGIALVAETMRGFHKGADLVVDVEMQQKLSQLRNPGVEMNALDSMLKRRIGIAEILKKEEKQHEPDSQGMEVANLNLSEGELIGRLSAQRLLLEIHYGGVIDTAFQHIPFLFMSLAEEHQPCKVRLTHKKEVSPLCTSSNSFQVKLSRLTPYAVQFLRHLKDFSGVVFSFKEFTVQQTQEETAASDDDEDSEPEAPLEKIPQVIVECAGMGFKNIGRKTF